MYRRVEISTALRPFVTASVRAASGAAAPWHRRQRVFNILQGREHGFYHRLQGSRSCTALLELCRLDIDAACGKNVPGYRRVRPTRHDCCGCPRVCHSSPRSPNDPVRENRGNRSAIATPIRAVAACSCASARRTSGRRRRSSDGTPTATCCGLCGIGAHRGKLCLQRRRLEGQQHGQAVDGLLRR